MMLMAVPFALSGQPCRPGPAVPDL
jgi:hypothetical protein